jgi:DNA-binding LacI/PurR family transcriptional regulator
MPPTSHDVARLAGVSRAAVSRTYTQGASVSEDTRKRVLRAAKTLGYRPNLFARSLKTRRSRILGLAISTLDSTFYAEFVQLFSARLALEGYRLLLFITRGSEGRDPDVEELLAYHVDALILASTTLSSRLAEECDRVGMPVVMFNNVDPAGRTTTLSCTDAEGGQLVADFLVAGGHRRFAYISGFDVDSTSSQRGRAYAARLKKHGIAPPLRAEGNFHYADASRAMRSLLSQPNVPDAVFCATDDMAVAALQVAQYEFHMRPGTDISIVGFDNVPLAAWPCFGLTTYEQPIHRLAERLLDLVKNAIERNAPAETHERIAGALVVRTSARLPAAGLVSRADGSKIWEPAPGTSRRAKRR